MELTESGMSLQAWVPPMALPTTTGSDSRDDVAMTRVEVIVTLVVGFGSGLVGAFAGGWSQRWLYRVRREDERLDDLREYYRSLVIVYEHLTNEQRGEITTSLGEVENGLYRHFRYLPRELIEALEADEGAMTRTSSEVGENLWGKAVVLKKYLDAEQHPIRHRLVRAFK